MIGDIRTETVRIGSYEVGGDSPLLLIAGPCVLQDDAICDRVAEVLLELNGRPDVNVVFKASFDKANRTSATAERGPGLDEGLQMLDRVRTQTKLPVTTDLHTPAQAAAVGQVCDILQIPAFLARQTDLLVAAAQTGRVVNVKKGQFMAPTDMRFAIDKVRHGSQTAGAAGDAASPQLTAGGVMVCERGTFFGYGRLVNDMAGVIEMRQLGVPVVFDATHSVQRPGVSAAGGGGSTGGNREMVEPLARAAVALGVDALFFETHPQPNTSPSDGANMIPLAEFPALVDRCLRLRAASQAIE